ncbi:MAG TPA: glycosyltransferase family 4 protein [Herpetosiphonaceae bacterium]
MRIALVAQPVERVPPVRSGAVELIVSNLAEGLVERGHDVTLFASGDSRTRARLVAPVRRAIQHDLAYDGLDWWPQSILIAQVLERQREFDIINSHAGYWFLPALHALTTPAVLTFHGYVHRKITTDILAYHRTAPLVAVSNYQRAATAALDLNWVDTIYNGVATSDLTYADQIGEYLLFLGRVVPVKRPDAAIRVALAAGIRIVVAGPVLDGDYFDHVIRPLLRNPGVEYVGEVVGEQRRSLLSGALGLIHTAEWESFGVSLIEAMASGTPVVCSDRASMPELVLDGVTGYVCASLNEMRDACWQLSGISRAACRAHFLRNFTADTMVDRYVQCYERLAATGSARV